MTIRQQGGVFGRNPTFNDVETKSLKADTVDINGGSVDAVTLGTNSAVTEAQVDNLNLNGNAIISTNTDGDIALTPNGTGEVDISKVDIDGGTIDGTAIGGASAAAGTFTTATATTGNITTVNATTVDATTVEVTNIKAKDGTASATIADSTGVMTIASSVLTTADINGGTIDGTVIGGSTSAAISGTTGAFSGNLTVSGTLNIGGSEIGANEVVVADDAVATITPPRLGGFAFLVTNADTFPNVSGSTLIYYDAGSSAVSRRLVATSGTAWTGTTGDDVDVTTGALTGTTGSDGKVTVSAVGDGTIQIENRLGASTQFNLTFL